MKKVNIYNSDNTLHKSFISIRDSANFMKLNVSMVRKFLSEVKKDPKGFIWKFN